LKIEVDNGSLTPELLKETLGLRIGQVKRFLVESRNPQGIDDLVVLLSKVSSQDIATFPEKLKELDGVREVTVSRKASDDRVI
jgi:putative Mg2+ transporter-C (MgtC) family protein